MPTTYDKLATETLSSAQASVTFSTISQSYSDLVIICNFGAATASQDFTMRFNGDTGANYSNSGFYGTGSVVVAKGSSGDTRIVIDSVGVSTSLQAVDIIDIIDYKNTSKYKSCLLRVADIGKSYEIGVGAWRSNSAITSITLAMTSGNLLSGSTFTLYGILKA